MLISIIVPVYNIQEYVKECVDSILKQSYSDIECILVDDGSKDNSPEICDNYSKQYPQIQVVHKQNGGLAAARNTGLLCAKGEYVYFLDGDDKLEENAISNFVSALAEQGNCDFVIGHMASFVDDSKAKPFPNVVKKEWVQGKTGKDAFIEICKNTHSIMMGVRGLYSRNFLLDNNLTFLDSCRYSEDQEWTPRVFEKAQKVGTNENPDYLYRLGRPGSLMNTLSLSKMELTLQVYDGWYRRTILNPKDEFCTCLYNLLIYRYWSLYFHYTPMVNKDGLEEFCEMMERRRCFCMYPKAKENKVRRFVIKHFCSYNIIRLTKIWGKIKGL